MPDYTFLPPANARSGHPFSSRPGLDWSGLYAVCARTQAGLQDVGEVTDLRRHLEAKLAGPSVDGSLPLKSPPAAA